MIVTSVTYTLRLGLDKFEHEELTAEVSNEAADPKEGTELMALARRVCWENTTKAKRKAAAEAAAAAKAPAPAPTGLTPAS